MSRSFALGLVVVLTGASPLVGIASAKTAGSGGAQRSRPVSDSPTNFYRRLTEAISTLEGHAALYFNQGHWETRSHAAGPNIHWTVDDGTTADVQAKYVNRALDHASITFNKPIHIWFSVTNGVSFSVTKLEYNSNGDLISDNRKPDNLRSSHYAGGARADRIFSITTSPEKLLKGRVLANIDSLALCDAHEKRCQATDQPLIYEVTLKRTPTSPGLLVTLGPDTTGGSSTDVTLPLSQGDSAASPPNFLVLETGSSLLLDDVSYYVDEHYVEGTLTALALRLGGGRISTGDLSLAIAPGSSFKAQRLAFVHDGNTHKNTLTADHAFLEAGLAAGSRIQIATATSSKPETESYLTLREGSSVKLRDVVFSQDDGTNTSIGWSNASQQDLLVAGGQLNVGPGSYVTLAYSEVHMNLAGTWELGHPPRVSATEVSISAQMEGGQLAINSGTTLRLGQGDLKGEHLALDSTSRPILRGTLTKLDVAILRNTVVAFPGSMTFVTDSHPSKLSLDPSGTGVRIGFGSDYPVGRYQLDVSFSAFDNASSKNFELDDGQAHLPIETLADGTIQNPRLPSEQDWKITGTLSVAPHGGRPLTIASTIVGSFILPRTGAPRFAGTLSGVGKAGFAISFATPSIGMAPAPAPTDDLYVYSLALTLAVTNDFPVPTTNFVINGDGRASVKIALNPSFELRVDTGKGEHESKSDPGSADGTHGPGEIHGWQEVLQTTKVCTLHMYLAPKTLVGAFQAQLTVSPTDLTVDVTELHFDHDLADPGDYRRDGCDPTLLGGILGGLLGGLPGTIGGVILGHVANQKLDDLIRERVGGFVNSLDRSWHMQFS